MRSVVFANVRQAPYNAAGNGISDDTDALQSAIDDCPPGQVVYVPAGNYLVSRKIVMKSEITLRGDGIGSTLIKGAAGHADPFIIGFEKPGIWYDMVYETPKPISGGLTKGSSSIAVSGTGWSAGDIILIDQLEDPSGDPMITNNGTDGTCTWCGRQSGDRPIGQVVEIESVGGTVSLEVPLYYNFDVTRAPQAVRMQPSYMTILSGVEDLTVDNSLSYSSAQYNYAVVYMACTSKCWLLNVEIKTTYKTGVKISYSYGNVIRGCTIHNSYGYTSDAGYGMYLGFGVSATLIENNIFHDLTTGIIYNGPVSGNVIAYNYMTDMKHATFPTAVRHGLTAHGGHPVMNLFEGNYLEGVGIVCDLYWGTASHNTYLRNVVAIDTTKTVGTVDVALFKGHTYYNLVGNVLGTNGFETKYEDADFYNGRMIYNLDHTPAGAIDGRTAATLIRHGNFDYVYGSVIWDPGIADHSLPNSYYLSSQPSWWTGAAWPSIGPDRTPMRGDIPARIRAGSIVPIQPEPQSPLSPTRLRIKS